MWHACRLATLYAAVRDKVDRTTLPVVLCDRNVCMLQMRKIVVTLLHAYLHAFCIAQGLIFASRLCEWYLQYMQPELRCAQASKGLQDTPREVLLPCAFTAISLHTVSA